MQYHRWYTFPGEPSFDFCEDPIEAARPSRTKSRLLDACDTQVITGAVIDARQLVLVVFPSALSLSQPIRPFGSGWR